MQSIPLDHRHIGAEQPGGVKSTMPGVDGSTHSDDDAEHNPSADSIHPSNRGGEHPVLLSADEILMEWWRGSSESSQEYERPGKNAGHLELRLPSPPEIRYPQCQGP